MIVPIPGQYGQDEYLVCPSVPTPVVMLRARMLRRANARKDSYAFKLVEDLHDAIFLHSLDLKRDYHVYFVREYASFAQYLARRERLSPEIVRTIAALEPDSSGVFRFRPSLSFLTDNSGRDLLEQLIEDVPPAEAV